MDKTVGLVQQQKVTLKNWDFLSRSYKNIVSRDWGVPQMIPEDKLEVTVYSRY